MTAGFGSYYSHYKDLRNPLMHGRFPDPYFKVLWEGVILNLLIFFLRHSSFIWASATKSYEGSRIFRYGFPKDILRKGQKITAAIIYLFWMSVCLFFCLFIYLLSYLPITVLLWIFSPCFKGYKEDKQLCKLKQLCNC